MPVVSFDGCRSSHSGLLRTISDVASELTRQRWCVCIATIKDLDIVTPTAAVNLVVVTKCVATQPVGAAFQVHLGEVNVYSLVFGGSDANAAVKVISAAYAKHHIGRQSRVKKVRLGWRNAEDSSFDALTTHWLQLHQYQSRSRHFGS